METSLRSLRTLVRRHLLVGQRQPPRPFPIVIQTTEAPQQKIRQTRTPKGIPRVVFPGAGIFFYWQAGAVTYLRGAGYDLDQTITSGASAGAITATLCATHVDFYYATDVALRLGREAGVWNRPMGLMGVWGSLIEEWLDIILPAEAAEMANNNRLSILLTQFPSILQKQRIDDFVDRDDLIRCNIASVHLPLFLDGSVASSYRDSLHIDGSFLSSPMDHFPDCAESILTFDFQHDPELKGKKKEFVKLASEDGILSLLDRGAEFAA